MERRKVKNMFIVVGVIGVILLLFIYIVFPPSSGKMPQFRDESGAVLPDSVSEKCYIDVDGGKIGMMIMAENKNRPVLLLCGGGPGISEYLLEDMYPTGLAEKFVVCYLEYRGTGLSYASDCRTEDLTTERYIADVVAVTKYLSERFQQERIYIMGHSFGSYVAIKTVQDFPQYYHAYFAMSQMCNQKESEYLAWEYMKEQYEQAGNKKMVERFEALPIRESQEMYEQYMFSSMLRDTAMHELGVGTTRDMNSVITDLIFPSLRCKAFTWKERINIWRAKMISSKFPITYDAWNENVFEEVKTLEIPIYFFAGKYDYTCCYSLQEEFYNQIEAPKKEFYVFEHAAHSPIFECPEEAKEIFEQLFGE